MSRRIDSHQRVVLEQGSPECDVEHLHTPTDSENRDIGSDRGAQQRKFDDIVLIIDTTHRRMCGFVVPRRVDVTSTLDQYAVGDADEITGIGVGEWCGWHLQNTTSGTLDGFDVQPSAGESGPAQAA